MIRQIYISLLLILFTQKINAKEPINRIFESSDISSILEYIKKDKVNKNSLIILDLDNTVFEGSQELGSEQWFSHQLLQHQVKEKISFSLALKKTLKEYAHIQIETSVKMVDEKMKDFMSFFNQKNTLISVTSRGYENSLWTLEQIKSLDLSFTETAVKNIADKKLKSIAFENPLPNKDNLILYTKGILFTSGGNKGELLFTLLEKMNYKPSSIYFVDDKEDHIKKMQAACIKRGIRLTAWRYSFLDHKVKNFKADITKVQLDNFLGKEKSHILSDKEAQKILQKKLFNTYLSYRPIN